MQLCGHQHRSVQFIYGMTVQHFRRISRRGRHRCLIARAKAQCPRKMPDPRQHTDLRRTGL